MSFQEESVRSDTKKNPKTIHTPDFGGHVEHHGYDRRVIVAVDDEAHIVEFPPEVGSVLGKLPEAIGT